MAQSQDNRPQDGRAGNRGAAPFSMLGADLVVKGDITAAQDLHIDGRIEGDIACAALVLGEAGAILGAITARSARIGGRVEGAVNVGELVIQRSAQVLGDVTYDKLTIEPGAQVHGRFTPANHPASQQDASGGPFLLAADHETAQG